MKGNTVIRFNVPMEQHYFWDSNFVNLMAGRKRSVNFLKLIIERIPFYSVFSSYLTSTSITQGLASMTPSIEGSPLLKPNVTS